MGIQLLKVLQPGLLTTVQDTGRFKYQKFGYTQAGAMDDFALRLGNRLVGNGEDEAGLEITFLGAEFLTLEDCIISITGADFTPVINNTGIPMWQSLPVKKDSVISFKSRKHGARAYLCLQGGLEIPLVLGSKSTDLKSSFGGYQGRKLKAGDILSGPDAPLKGKHVSRYFPRRLVTDNYRWDQNPQEIRVTLGPDMDHYTEEGYRTLLSGTYTISHKMDRQGYQLGGPKIEHSPKGPNIVTNFTSLGAIQVPGAGIPILLMKDRQTSGGYAKIANVVTPDISKLAQKSPGEGVTFVEVDSRQAREIYVNHEKIISNTDLGAGDFSLRVSQRRKLNFRYRGG